MPERVSDAILLERFVRGREEAAFATLVRRHGPLVERICREILGNPHDVDDVFQATFLVLARKAGGIAWRESVGGWLTAVARRLAMHARSSAARQRGRETTLTALAGSRPAGRQGELPEKYHPLIDPSVELEWRDLRRVLDDELLRLPEKYRAPILLCDLEGQTHEEAAQQLGWPAGSMSRRLGRARTLLRRRLAHRGVALGVIGLVAVAVAAAVVGTGRVFERNSWSGALREAMVPVEPPEHGELGLGPVLAAILRPEGPRPRPGSEQVARLAAAAAESTARLETDDPGWRRSEWRQYASEMRRSALELAEASRAGDPIVLVAAARRLDASCLKCHRIFHQ